MAVDGVSASAELGHCEPETVHLLMESSSQSQERFRLMVESIRDYAIVMLDPEGRVASWNVGAERILGYRRRRSWDATTRGSTSREDVGSGSRSACLEKREAEESSRSRAGGGARTTLDSGPRSA